MILFIESLHAYLSDPAVAAAASVASSVSSCAALLAAVAIFRKQERKTAQVCDLQFMIAHRKTLSDLLQPLVEPERKHVFQAAELLSALEQGAYSFNHKLVGHWARASFHDEFLGLLKLALADETLLRFVQQNDDNCRSYHEILAFMEANKRMFGGELRSIIAQRAAPVRLGGPKFQLNPWRMHQAIVAASKRRLPRAHRKRQRRVAADA